MTTGTAAPPRGLPHPQFDAEPDECETLVDQRLRQTRSQVKRVDLQSRLVALAAATLAYLFLAAMLDHWLIPAGLGFWGRFLLFAVLVAGAGSYLVVQVVPVLIRRVNPIFAAYSIEQSRPSLKNGLINLLFLRRQRATFQADPLAAAMYRSLQHQAAAELEQVPADVAVDRSHLIRLGYLLAAILALCALYLMISPKNPLVSFGRVIWPWAELKAPTRVRIDDVQPGDAVVYQGEFVAVSAAVAGLKPGERVILYYSTADGQSVDQAVPMTLPEGGSRYRCELPPGRFGLQQDLEYYLASGDCRTQRFQLKLAIAPAILVDSVEYDYPEYTGIPDRVDHRVADLRAIEGTRVTVRASANEPIGRAVVELDCDPRHALRMTLDGPTAASARWTLMVDEKDPARPQYESYQLRFLDPAQRESQKPIRHRIEVIRDLPPEVRLVDPPPDRVNLPLDGSLELRVDAEDPDFALRRVAVRAERDGQPLAIPTLLDKPRPAPPHVGPYRASYAFKPAELGLKPGDEVVYWVEAQDDKFWESDLQLAVPPSSDAKSTQRFPNRTETTRRWIIITPPEGRGGPQQPPDESAQQPTRAPDHQRAQGPGEETPKDAEEARTEPPAEPEQPHRTSEAGKPPDQKQPPEKQPADNGVEQGPADATAGEQPQPYQPQESQQQPEERPGQAPAAEEPDAEQTGEKQGPGSKTSPSPPSTQEAPSSQPGQDRGQKGSQPAGEPPAPAEPIDWRTNPGDAFEEILNRLNEEKRQESSAQQPGAQSPQPSERQQIPQAHQPHSGQQQPGPQATGTEAAGKSQPEKTGTPQSQRPQGQQPSQPPAGEAAPMSQGEQQSPRQQQETPQSEQTEGDQQRPGEQPHAGPEASGARQPDSEQRMPDNQPGGSQSQAPGEQPKEGQGAQAQGPGKPSEEKPQAEGPAKPDARGGDPQQSKGAGGAGRQSPEDAGGPSPQEASQPRDKHLGEGDQSPPSENQSPQSPTISPKESDSQGDTSGDRSGGGEQGGGQKSKQPGTGTAGIQTAAEQGGSQAQQQGEGEAGTGPGDRVRAERPTGRSADQGEGPGSKQSAQPAGEGAPRPSQEQQGGQPAAELPPTGQPPAASPDEKGPGQTPAYPSGTPAGGGSSANERIALPPQPGAYRPEDPNLDYARKQTNMVLEYLQDQLAKDRPDQKLLDRLGWSKDDLRRFYQQWERLRREAEQSEAGRKELDKAIGSLGLRPRSIEIGGGRTKADRLGNLREGLRIDPPPDWAEAYRAYQMGVSNGEE